MSILKQSHYNGAFFTALIVLLVLGGGSCNSRFTNRHSNSDSTALKPNIAVNDSVLWFENISSIELEFAIDGLHIEIFGMSEGAIARYSNLYRMERQRQRVLYSLLEGVDDTKEEKFLELKLDMEIWRNILKRLFDTGIREWAKARVGRDVPCPSYITVLGDISWWRLGISNMDSEDILVGTCGWFAYDSPTDQPDWSIFYGEMSDIIKNIIKIPRVLIFR